MRNDFSTFDIIKALGIPRERLRSWMKDNFVKPTVPADGVGTRAVFTRWDVYGIELFKGLVESGFIRRQAADYVRWFIGIEKESENKPVDYLIFNEVVRDGKKGIVSMHVSGTNWAVDLKTMRIGEYKGDGKFNPMVAPGHDVMNDGLDPDYLKDWDQAHLVHFGRLKKRVDLALEDL